MGSRELIMGRILVKFLKGSMNRVLQLELHPFLTPNHTELLERNWFKNTHVKEVEDLLKPVVASLERLAERGLNEKELKKLSQGCLVGSTVRVGFTFKQKSEQQSLLLRSGASRGFRSLSVQSVMILAYVCPRLQNHKTSVTSAFRQLLKDRHRTDNNSEISHYFHKDLSQQSATQQGSSATSSSTSSKTTAMNGCQTISDSSYPDTNPKVIESDADKDSQLRTAQIGGSLENTALPCLVSPSRSRDSLNNKNALYNLGRLSDCDDSESLSDIAKSSVRRKSLNNKNAVYNLDPLSDSYDSDSLPDIAKSSVRRKSLNNKHSRYDLDSLSESDDCDSLPDIVKPSRRRRKFMNNKSALCNWDPFLDRDDCDSLPDIAKPSVSRNSLNNNVKRNGCLSSGDPLLDVCALPDIKKPSVKNRTSSNKKNTHTDSAKSRTSPNKKKTHANAAESRTSSIKKKTQEDSQRFPYCPRGHDTLLDPTLMTSQTRYSPNNEGSIKIGDRLDNGFLPDLDERPLNVKHAELEAEVDNVHLGGPCNNSLHRLDKSDEMGEGKDKQKAQIGIGSSTAPNRHGKHEKSKRKAESGSGTAPSRHKHDESGECRSKRKAESGSGTAPSRPKHDEIGECRSKRKAESDNGTAPNNTQDKHDEIGECKHRRKAENDSGTAPSRHKHNEIGECKRKRKAENGSGTAPSTRGKCDKISECHLSKRKTEIGIGTAPSRHKQDEISKCKRKRKAENDNGTAPSRHKHDEIGECKHRRKAENDSDTAPNNRHNKHDKMGECTRKRKADNGSGTAGNTCDKSDEIGECCISAKQQKWEGLDGEDSSRTGVDNNEMLGLDTKRLGDMVIAMQDEIMGIFQEMVHSVLHNLFQGDCASRRMLDNVRILKYFRDDQHEAATNTVLNFFPIDQQMRLLDYIVRVLVPEALSRVYLKVTGKLCDLFSED